MFESGPVSQAFDQLPYSSPSKSRQERWELWRPLIGVVKIKRSCFKDSLKLINGFFERQFAEKEGILWSLNLTESHLAFMLLSTLTVKF